MSKRRDWAIDDKNYLIEMDYQTRLITIMEKDTEKIAFTSKVSNDENIDEEYQRILEYIYLNNKIPEKQ